MMLGRLRSQLGFFNKAGAGGANLLLQCVARKVFDVSAPAEKLFGQQLGRDSTAESRAGGIFPDTPIGSPTMKQLRA